MASRAIVVLFAAVAALAGVSCSSDDERPAPTAPERSEVQAERCLVRLHGRSESGAEPVDAGDHAEVSPTGNDTAEGGFQWVYGTPDELAEATDRVESWLDAVGCREVILNGFSNGGGLLGALHCSGETFDGRVVGVVIDDPVPDDAVTDCGADPEVPVAVYWTGGLDRAVAGAACDDLGFTCAGERLLGIDAYAEALGSSVTASPHKAHEWYRQAPETTAWPDRDEG